MKKITTLILIQFLSIPLTAHSVEFTLFGDIVFSKTSGAENSDSFNLGEFDLIADQDVGQDTSVTSELVFEDAGHGYEVDVERFSITRKFNPLFSAGLGRFHNHLGIWNQNFHHGSLIQDTISRPFFLEFEDNHGGIFPNHIVGLYLSGDSQYIGYQLGISNSNGINTTGAENHPGDATLEIINTNDPSREKSVVLRLAIKPNFLLDEIGLFYMNNHVLELGEDNGSATPFLDYGETLFEQQIAGFDLRYTGEKLYGLFELFYAKFDDNQSINATAPSPQLFPNPESYYSLAYYGQLGYHVTEKLSLVGRFEHLEYDGNATYFELLTIPQQNRTVVALNYKLQESNSIRVEVSSATPENEDTVNTFGVQWFFILF